MSYVSPTGQVEPAKRRAWFRRGVVTVPVALVIGLVIGASLASSDPTESEQYKKLRVDMASVEGDLADARSDVQSSESRFSASEAELEEWKAAMEVSERELQEARDEVGDLPEREAALKRGQDALRQDRAAVARRQQELAVAEQAVQERERKVGVAETTIANNTLNGDGVYRVGTDMQPGTYKSVGNRGCYWQLSQDSNGSNLVDNGFVDGGGQALATVAAGQFFETSDCGDWVLQ